MSAISLKEPQSQQIVRTHKNVIGNFISHLFSFCWLPCCYWKAAQDHHISHLQGSWENRAIESAIRCIHHPVLRCPDAQKQLSGIRQWQGNCSHGLHWSQSVHEVNTSLRVLWISTQEARRYAILCYAIICIYLICFYANVKGRWQSLSIRPPLKYLNSSWRADMKFWVLKYRTFEWRPRTLTGYLGPCWHFI